MGSLRNLDEAEMQTIVPRDRCCEPCLEGLGGEAWALHRRVRCRVSDETRVEGARPVTVLGRRVTGCQCHAATG